MANLIITLGVLGLIALAINIYAGRQITDASHSADAASNTAPPYAKNRYLLSKAEKSFYLVLRQAVPTDHAIFPKVRVADVLHVRKGASHRQRFVNQITSKHFDFLICDRQWLEPRMAIELDDASHQRSDRSARDRFLVEATSAAGLPLLQCPARSSYNVNNLRAVIARKLNTESVPTARPVETDS